MFEITQTSEIHRQIRLIFCSQIFDDFVFFEIMSGRKGSPHLWPLVGFNGKVCSIGKGLGKLQCLSNFSRQKYIFSAAFR